MVSHIPRILRTFNETFKDTPNFSIVRLQNYTTYFHEANGALQIPQPINIKNPVYREYFCPNRTRVENDHYFTRGPLYYRHYIEEIKEDSGQQDSIVSSEILSSIRALLDTDPNPGTLEEYLLRIAVIDNLRGNLLSIFLSTINPFREGETVDDLSELKNLSDSAKYYYEKAIELQYCLLLGLDCDEKSILEEFSEISIFLNLYKEYNKQNGFVLKHKNPEIDHQLNIAMRANEACIQYPESDIFLGLSSGGVELATVAKLLAEKLYSRSTSVLHYPISTHHGLTMWQSDKRERKTDQGVCEYLSLSSIAGQRVVICEDNSNSGQTLNRAVQMANEKGASKVNFAVIEVDPTRVILHSVQQKAGAKHNIGEAAKRNRPIANYFYPDFVGAVSVVKILPADQSFSKVIALDTANKYKG